jgi:hypothetical protein
LLINVLWQSFTIILLIWKIWKLRGINIVHWIRQHIRLALLLRSLLWFHRCLHLIKRLSDLL